MAESVVWNERKRRESTMMMWSCRNSRNCILTLWLEHVDVAIAGGVVVHCLSLLGSFMLGAAMCGVPEPFGTCSGTCAITVRRLAALRVFAPQPSTLPCHMMVDVVICYAAVCSLCCVVPAVLHVGAAAAPRSVCCLSTIYIYSLPLQGGAGLLTAGSQQKILQKFSVH